MAHCNSKPKKMERGGVALEKKKKKKKKMLSGPIPMPQAVRNMRERMKSKGGAGEAGPGYVKMQNGGCVMAGRGGKFKGIS
jgi:hypothetical protein